MKRNLFLVIASVLTILSLAACSTTPTVTTSGALPQPRTVSASGQGEIYLVPDLAHINVGVRVEADEVSTALNDNNIQANAVAQAMIDLGVDQKDIQTSSFSVYPMQDWGPDGTITRRYYVVENIVYITVRDLSVLGNLLDAVVRSGANTINGITFDIEDKDEAMAQARDLAIQKAMAEAEAIAATAGVHLGDLQSVNVYVNDNASPVYEAKGGYSFDAAASVPVSAGQMIITATADMVYTIK